MKTTILMKNVSILHETVCDAAAPSYTFGDEEGVDEPVGSPVSDPVFEPSVVRAVFRTIANGVSSVS